MLSFKTPAVYQASKCFVTYGIMGHLDPKQPPSKGKPWATLASQDFVHSVDLIVPAEAHDAVQEAIAKRPAPEFRRIVLSLREVLGGEFFTEYVKKGDIMMLSQGRIGIDNVYCLKNGVLTMFLDKEAYESAGLVGKPHGVKGKRGLKPRWVVEFDLKGDSMIHGKKGFDRLVYASKNALGAPVTWLFCNTSKTTLNPDPVQQYSTTSQNPTPQISADIDAIQPSFQSAIASIASGDKDDLETYSTEIYEWLSLIRLESPRVHAGDQIDPFLSRYQVPEGGTRAKVCKISWHGFISPSWCRQVLIDVVAAVPSKTWFSFSTTTFSKGIAGEVSECAFLRAPGPSNEYLMWEVKTHE
ncbi:ribonuclease P 40kDa subunit-domain-containing protein [Schizothecium vesticola]|uniref:Ribonuclease P 40kDa subunit-domain-containing protein n=1 Tax=Schizothecium vesticola TaxID=314040 RepID=A0AA40EQ29_9PEZI|nr:ribonuclease P 40kDa subunit-domain-containing protein [Schizothecium vesticola]